MTVHPYVRTSAPQGHQYEVAYTGYNAVLNPVFLARNRMVTRVVTKDKQRQQKWKTNLLIGKKVQKNTQLSFWWKAKSSI